MWRSLKKTADNLVERGLLTPDQAAQALTFAEQNSVSLTRAALSLGFLQPRGPHYGPGGVELFVVQSAYYPMNTRGLLTQDEITQYGALPLGYKAVFKRLRLRRIVNVGLLAPENASVRSAVENILRSRVGTDFDSARFYWITLDDFNRVLEQIYGLKPGD